MPKIIFCILFNLFACTTFAQIEAFKVIAIKGFPSLSSGRIITVGGVLFENEILKVEQPCYLALIHKSGKTLEIKEAGKYKLANISKKFKIQNLFNNQELADFLLISFTPNKTKSKSRYDFSDRHLCNIPSKIIKINLPRKLKMLEGSLPLIWNSEQKLNIYKNDILWKKEIGEITYKVEITDFSDSILFEKQTKDTFLLINTNEFKLNFNKIDEKYSYKYKYLLNIIDGKDSEDNFSKFTCIIIEFPWENEALEIQNKIIELNATYSDLSAIDCMLKASFYCKNNYFLNAKYYYELALKLQPDILEYKNAYINFMNKFDLSDFIRE